MAKTRDDKKALLEKYIGILEKYDGFLVVEASKIDNNSITQLKKELDEIGSEYSVVKNSVFKIALREKSLPTETMAFDGSSAVVSYKEDPTKVAKILKKIQKDSELLKSKFGYVESKYLNSEKSFSLADIPSREELLAKLLGSMSSPISGFVTVAKGNLRGLTQIFDGLSKK